MRRISLILVLLLAAFGGFGQTMATFQYAEKEGKQLFLDYYEPSIVTDSTICVFYVFGGGFMEGQRNGESEKNYFAKLVDEGFMVVAIDYRLGLVGAKNLGITNYKPVQNAIYMAAEDAISALAFIIECPEMKVNRDLIVMVGSSAGAITVLQADYALCNGFLNAEILPEDFRPAGVVSYSGAIFSREGRVKYRNHKPAPTMLLHGTSDKLVNYNQLKLFCIGMFGTNKLVPRFEKYDLPFFVRRYKDYGHSVASFCPNTVDELKWFCKHFVLNKEQLQIDEMYVDNSSERPSWDNSTPDDLYK